ncbi:MAG: hypothetical protein COB10_12290, partial [Planctomycetota bacterium]
MTRQRKNVSLPQTGVVSRWTWWTTEHAGSEPREKRWHGEILPWLTMQKPRPVLVAILVARLSSMVRSREQIYQ